MSTITLPFKTDLDLDLATRFIALLVCQGTRFHAQVEGDELVVKMGS